MTHVAPIGLTGEPADPGNSRWKISLSGRLRKAPPLYLGFGATVNFQGVVMNVADLNRSIDFYREVLDFTLLSQKEQLAALSVPGSDRTQVIVLRAFGSGRVDGARHIGLRAFVLEDVYKRQPPCLLLTAT